MEAITTVIIVSSISSNLVEFWLFSTQFVHSFIFFLSFFAVSFFCYFSLLSFSSFHHDHHATWMDAIKSCTERVIIIICLLLVVIFLHLEMKCSIIFSLAFMRVGKKACKPKYPLHETQTFIAWIHSVQLDSKKEYGKNEAISGSSGRFLFSYMPCNTDINRLSDFCWFHNKHRWALSFQTCSHSLFFLWFCILFICHA